jgi:hypothetical protein
MTQPSILGAQVKMANAYSLTVDEVHRALSWARMAKAAAGAKAETLIGHPEPKRERRAQWDFGHVPEPKDGKSYCAQCDRRVAPDETERCLDSFCRAPALKFLGEAISDHEADKRRAIDCQPCGDSERVAR